MLLTVTHYCRDTTWSSSPSQSRTCSVELSSPSTLSGLKGEVWHQISSVELTADQLTKSVYNTESEVLLMPALLDHKGICNTSELILDLDCFTCFTKSFCLYSICNGNAQVGILREFRRRDVQCSHQPGGCPHERLRLQLRPRQPGPAPRLQVPLPAAGRQQQEEY